MKISMRTFSDSGISFSMRFWESFDRFKLFARYPLSLGALNLTCLFCAFISQPRILLYTRSCVFTHKSFARAHGAFGPPSSRSSAMM